jgi:hypothetical protein
MNFNEAIMDIVFYKPDRAALMRYLNTKNKIKLLERFNRNYVCSQKIVDMCRVKPNDRENGYKIALCHGSSCGFQDEEFITIDSNCLVNPDLMFDLNSNKDIYVLEKLNIPHNSCNKIISFNSPHYIINGNFIQYFLLRLRKGGRFHFVGFKKPYNNNSKTIRLIALINKVIEMLSKFKINVKILFRYERLKYGKYSPNRPDLCLQIV